uniref:Uncharacterized protein n=1 Tax=Schistocephalus solidus TaxID=70667 RepID=A0A183SQJ3_SCHSO
LLQLQTKQLLWRSREIILGASGRVHDSGEEEEEDEKEQEQEEEAEKR